MIPPSRNPPFPGIDTKIRAITGPALEQSGRADYLTGESGIPSARTGDPVPSPGIVFLPGRISSPGKEPKPPGFSRGTAASPPWTRLGTLLGLAGADRTRDV